MINLFLRCLTYDFLYIQDYIGQEKYKLGRRKPYAVSTWTTEMHKNKNAYRSFLSHFIGPAMGKQEYNARMKDETWPADKLFTVSDEAFALLYVENCWERWNDIFEKNEKSQPAPTRRDKNGEFHKACESEVETKYTHGGYNFGNKNPEEEDGRMKGWSASMSSLKR